MLTDEETQLVVGLGVALHLLIEQGKSKPCLEVCRHNAQELFVVETCKLIAPQLLVGIGTEIERRQMPAATEGLVAIVHARCCCNTMSYSSFASCHCSICMLMAAFFKRRSTESG